MYVIARRPSLTRTYNYRRRDSLNPNYYMSTETNATGGSAGTDVIDDSKLPIFKELDPNNPDDAKQAIEAAQVILGQRNHFQSKAIDKETGKPFSELYADSKKITAPVKSSVDTQTQEPKTEERLAKIELSEEKRQFGHHNNLSPEETDHLFAYAKGIGSSPADAMKTDFFKSGLDAFRQSSKNSSATPNPSNRAPKVDGKTFGQMERKDREANFASVVSSVTRRP